MQEYVEIFAKTMEGDVCTADESEGWLLKAVVIECSNVVISDGSDIQYNKFTRNFQNKKMFTGIPNLHPGTHFPYSSHGVFHCFNIKGSGG